MANTFVKTDLNDLSQKIYKEYINKTVLLGSCANEYEDDFDIDKSQVSIPVYGHLTLHKTSIKELFKKPAAPEFLNAGTITVTIGKVRYHHWAKTKLSEMLDKIQEEDSITRSRMTDDLAINAEEELAVAIVRNPAFTHLDITTLLGGPLTKTNILAFTEILKAQTRLKNMPYRMFSLFSSEKFKTTARDAGLDFSGEPANNYFKNGFAGMVDGLDLREHEVAALTNRNANTGVVEAEYAIFKTRDGVQYVTPWKSTDTYKLEKDQVMFGGDAYMSVELYDFFSIYTENVMVAEIKYTAEATLPTYTTGGTAILYDESNRNAVFGHVTR